MKSLILLAAAVALFSTQAHAESRTLCATEITDLRNDAKDVYDHWLLGELTRTSVADANLGVLEKQLSCGTILIDTFCNQAPAEAQIFVDGMIEESQVAMKTAKDVFAAKHRQADITNLCN